MAMSWTTVECADQHSITVVIGDQRAVVVGAPGAVVEMWRLNTTLVLRCPAQAGDAPQCTRVIQLRLPGAFAGQLGWHGHWFPGKVLSPEATASNACLTCGKAQCEPDGVPSLVQLRAGATPIEYHNPETLRLKDGEVAEWAPVNE